MIAKVFEIRDVGTFIPALAVDINSDNDAQHYLMRRCGYACNGMPNVILTSLHGEGKATNDAYSWGGRTWPVAHDYIIKHWHSLRDGDVVDVEFILGQSKAPKKSERFNETTP